MINEGSVCGFLCRNLDGTHVDHGKQKCIYIRGASDPSRGRFISVVGFFLSSSVVREITADRFGVGGVRPASHDVRYIEARSWRGVVGFQVGLCRLQEYPG